MKKVFIFSCFVIIFFSAGYTQNFAWVKHLEGAHNYDMGKSIVVDNSGYIYTTGRFGNTIDFDSGPGTFNLACYGGWDVFIAKYDSLGSLVWAKNIGGMYLDDAYQIILDSMGNIYITGIFTDTVDFDPGPGIHNLISAELQYDVFVLKLDTSGNFVWAKNIGGQLSDYAYSIAVDYLGNTYVTGHFADTADFDPGPGVYNLIAGSGALDVYVFKLNTSGNFVWAKQLESVNNWVMHGAVGVDSYSNVYVTGMFDDTNDFDPGPGTFNLTAAGGMLDIFLSKLDSMGNFVWAKMWGNSSQENCSTLVVDDLGNIYTSGKFAGSVDFDPGPGSSILSSVSGWDVFISKLNASGNFVWAKKMGGSGNDGGASITVDVNRNVYTTGWFQNTADFNPGAGSFNLTSNGGVDIFISKLDSIGNFSWAKSIGSLLDDQGSSVTVNALGEVYTTGIFKGTADFDTGVDTLNLTSAGGHDIYIHKLATCLSLPSPFLPDSLNGPVEVCVGDIISYSIDPINYATHYTWNLPPGWTGYSTTNSINVTVGGAGGNISVIASNACGSSAPQTLNITVNSLPTVTANVSPSLTICAGSNITLTGGGAVSYSWSGGHTDGVPFIPTSTATYTVTGTDGNSCTNTDTIMVTVNNLPPVMAIASPSSTICSGSDITLTGGGAVSYSWSGGVTNGVPFTPASTATYTVTGTGGNSCTNTDTIIVTINNLPSVMANASPSSTICSGSNITLTGGGAVSYLWNAGVNDGVPFTPASTTTYTVTGTDGNSCINTDTITVVVNNLPMITANASPSSTICSGSNITLTGGGAVSYLWSGGANDGVPFAPSSTTTYVVTGTDANLCTDTATITITVNDLPMVSFNYTGNDTICISYGIQPLNGGNPLGGSYFGPGVVGANFDPNISGVGTHIIAYTYTDGNGCSNSNEYSITVLGCAGTDLLEESNIIVYPNPFTNSISLNGINEFVVVKLYNALGEIIGNWIVKQTNTTIQTAHLHAGVYYIEIQTPNEIITQKMIKQDF